MPNLSDNFMLTQFVNKLSQAEAISDNLLTSWEVEFISHLRDSFDMRESQADLGISQWNPSANQWNTLDEIVARFA